MGHVTLAWAACPSDLPYRLRLSGEQASFETNKPVVQSKQPWGPVSVFILQRRQ